MSSTPKPAAVDRVERGANPALLLLARRLPVRRRRGLSAAAGRVRRQGDFLDDRGLAIFGVFSILLYTFGHLQFAGQAGRNDTTKAIADTNTDGLIVTDADSRIIYANEAYRDALGRQGRGRPQARRAAVLRRAGSLRGDLPARPGGARRQARAPRNCAWRRRSPATAPPPGIASACARWTASRAAGATLWTVSDITRERERHENFFQDLQHAIDYLDHAPAGFFSAEPDGAIAYHERDARRLARLRPRPVRRRAGSSSPTSSRPTARRCSDVVSGAPGEVKTEHFDVDLKRRQGQFLPVRLLHRVAFSSDGPPGASRTLVINRAPGEETAEDLRAAEVRFARFFNSTPMAIASIDADGAVLRANAAFARLAPAALQAGAGEARPSIYRGVAERDHAGLARGDRRRRRRQGRHRPGRRRARGRRRALGALLRLRRRSAAATKARAPPSSRSTRPSSARCRRISRRARRCRRSASSPAASRTTSTTC